MSIVVQEGFESVAFPIIGAGSGGMKQQEALEMMMSEFEGIDTDVRVKIVRYEKAKLRS
jgi:O-acetyl-ADP-ribose deacetylase (regulator of RNase III)